MKRSLCIWLTRTFEDLGPPSNLYNLADGEFLNKAMSSISPSRFTMLRVHKDVGDEAKARIDNLNFLLKNLIFFYEEVMSSMLVSRLPDVRLLGQQPQSFASSGVLETLITLILGVAFQCDNKTMYIEDVQQLPEDVQKELMTTIQELTETNRIVVSTYIDTDGMEKSEVGELCNELLTSLQSVVLERNELHDKYIRATQERDDYLDAQAARSGRRSTVSMNECSFNDSRSEGGSSSRPNTPGFSTEISDLRNKLLQYEEEIESKTDVINRLREENQASAEHIMRLKNEYRTLYDDAQSARIYRDEIDALRSKAEKLDKYEADIAKYRDKLEDMEYLKNRAKELKNHNDQLVEMNELLKEELRSNEQISKAIIAEEEKNIKLRAMLEEVGAQKEYGEKVIHDLKNKKKQIELELRHSANMVQHMQKEIDELTASNNETRLALLERDGEGGGVKFCMSAEKELSQDDQGQTPIVNRRRSTIKESGKDDPNIEVLNSKVKRLEIDNLHLKTQTETLKNSNARLQQFEECTEKDKLVIDTNKAEIARLQNEIQLEKTRIENVQYKVEEAYTILKEIGYDTDKLNEVNVLSDREKFLKYEERLKQSLNHSIKMKEERIAVLEDRVKENTSQNDSLRQELSIIKRQNKSVLKQNKSLQDSLDASISSIQSATSPTRRISKGVQYEHHVSMSSTPIKQRPSLVAMTSPKINISSIKENETKATLNDSNILNVSYDSVSLNESEVALQLLRQDCVDLKEDNDKLFLDKERLEQEVQELQVERKSHLTEIQNLREQVLTLKSKYEDRSREYKKQNTKLEEFEIECQALEEVNEKLKRACEELESDKNYVNAQCNKLLIQNQELLIKTIEDQEKNREETRVFQDQIMSMKQDNQHLAMNLAIKSQQGPSDGKKKPFYKTIFKSKKTKPREEGGVSGTPHIDEYLDQLSLDSTERLTPPDYDSNGFYHRDHFADSDNSSRTMSGDGRLEMQGSLNSLARGQDTSHISASRGPHDSPFTTGFRNPGITRTMSTDSERKTQSDDLTPRRHGSMRLKNKSESLDLTPRVEPRSMSRPIPPGTHGTPSVSDPRHGLTAAHRPQTPEQPHLGPRADLHRPLSSLSVQSLSSSSTGNRAVDQVTSEPPSAFRQFTSAAPALPPRNARPNSRHDNPRQDGVRHDPSSRQQQHRLHDSSRQYSSDSDFRPQSAGGSGSVVSDSYASSQRGLADEDPQNSSFYEYGCV